MRRAMTRVIGVPLRAAPVARAPSDTRPNLDAQRRSASTASTAATAATAFHVHVGAENTGLLKVPQTAEVARKVTELLQKDIDTHHCFFNNDGFHNHIVHHMLSLYGAGAAAADIQFAYDRNKTYQRPLSRPHDHIAEHLASWPEALKYMGSPKFYPDLFVYFRGEMDELGWQEALKKHLFAGTERSDDMLQRMFSGLLHPLIQLMYGLEWAQPAILASALAQAAIHKNRLGPFLDRAEKEAAVAADAASPMGEILDLFAAAERDPALRQHVAEGEPSNTTRLTRDGIEDSAPFVARVRVAEHELEERTAEMMQAALWLAAAATVHPPNVQRFDFFLIHHINLAPIFLTINAQPWIPTAQKIRILEWKIRINLINWLAVGAPSQDFYKALDYGLENRSPAMSPEELVPKFFRVDDDGHTIKLVRATLLCRDQLRKYADKPWVRIQGDDRWLRLAHLLVETTVDPEGDRWVRDAGFDSAWEDIPKLQEGRL